MYNLHEHYIIFNIINYLQNLRTSRTWILASESFKIIGVQRETDFTREATLLIYLQ